MMPVSFSMSKGMGTSGFTKAENRSVILPSTTFTAPISMILFFLGLNPVVSMSNTTKLSLKLCPFEFSTSCLVSSTRYPSTPYMTLKVSPLSREWLASGNAWTQPWSVTATAGIPHCLALLMMCFTSDTPSISLILVWQWSSTLFSRLLSMRLLVKSSVFLMPTMEPRVSSPSNLSMVVTPFTLIKIPGVITDFTSSKSSGRINIFTVNVSVKSLTSKVKINLPLRSSRFSQVRIFPLKVTSPISPSTFSISMGSSSKSRPYSTSGLLERLTEYFLSSPKPLSLSLPQPFLPLLSCGFSLAAPCAPFWEAAAPGAPELSGPAPISPLAAWAIRVSQGALSAAPESMNSCFPPVAPPDTSSWPSSPSVEKEAPMAASSSL